MAEQLLRRRPGSLRESGSERAPVRRGSAGRHDVPMDVQSPSEHLAAPGLMIRPDQITLSSTPATPVDSLRRRTSGDFALPSAEGVQHFALLALGHLEVIQGEAKFRGDLVEHGG